MMRMTISHLKTLIVTTIDHKAIGILVQIIAAGVAINNLLFNNQGLVESTDQGDSFLRGLLGEWPRGVESVQQELCQVVAHNSFTELTP